MSSVLYVGRVDPWSGHHGTVSSSVRQRAARATLLSGHRCQPEADVIDLRSPAAGQHDGRLRHAPSHRRAHPELGVSTSGWPAPAQATLEIVRRSERTS